MATIIILSIIGAIISAVVGTFWYSGATPMGKIHMRYMGFDKLSEEEKQRKMAEMKPKMGKMYTAQIILSLLTSFAVVFIVTESIHNGLSFTMGAGFVVLNWLTFMVPVIGSNILWSNCDRAIAWKKFFSDIFCNLVTVIIIAILASFVA